MTPISSSCLKGLLFLLSFNAFSQNTEQRQPATVILFRTFNIFSWIFNYKLHAGDSLLGRMKTHNVVIIESYDNGITFHTVVKAPSVNAGRRGNFTKTKKIVYPFTVKPGQVYFVKCGFLNQNLFEYPRQPTIKLLKPDEIKRYLKKRFLRRKIKNYLYEAWLNDHGIK